MMVIYFGCDSEPIAAKCSNDEDLNEYFLFAIYKEEIQKNYPYDFNVGKIIRKITYIKLT